jgi:hypothetical protein
MKEAQKQHTKRPSESNKRDNTRHNYYLIQPKTPTHLSFFPSYNTEHISKSYLHSSHHTKLATMCQLCALTTITKSSRWPKPLEPLISDLCLLINTAHTTLTVPKANSSAHDTKQKPSTTTKISITTTTTASKHPLLPTLHDINTLLELLEDERVQWWQAKAAERKFWRETYQEDKITGINVVNNKTVEMIEGLKAKLGGFCRWSLGLEDGVEGLGEERKDVKMEG